MARVLSELGFEAKRKSSGEWGAHCPKHFERLGKVDRKPSWSINEETGQHGCFSCGYKGSLAQLVVDVTEMDLWSALRWLRGLGMETLELEDEEEYVPPTNFLPTLEEEWSIFTRPPKSKRLSKHLSVEAIKYYDIRWRDDGWCIPITDFKGQWLGYQWKRDKQVYNYPDGVRKGVTLFGVDRFVGDGEIVLVESPLDVLRLYDLGYGGVATYGAQVTSEQLDLLVSFTDNVVVAMDDDIPGRTSARQIYEKLRYVVPDVKFVDYSGTKKRKDTGRRPKDIGDMTDGEIVRAVDDARYGSEAFVIGLVGGKVESKKKKVKPRVHR